MGTSPKNLHEPLRQYLWLKFIRRGSGSQSFIPAWNQHEMNQSQFQQRNRQNVAGWHGHCTSEGAEFM
jgi:hypothetical protein